MVHQTLRVVWNYVMETHGVLYVNKDGISVMLVLCAGNLGILQVCKDPLLTAVHGYWYLKYSERIHVIAL